ncbi:MAG: epimerase [Actinomycetota bacterium]
MRLLVIGGTQFVGRAFVEEAVREGHVVTVFHRGSTEPEGFPDAEHVHGDRDGGLGAIGGGRWDAVLDTCAYVPRLVRDVAAALRDNVEQYTLVSTLSVHADPMPMGANERTALHEPPFPDTEEITAETYGPLKVACEVEARTAWGDRLLIVRPGYIVGPHDPTDRFTYWVRRAAAGGRMLAPGPPDGPFQVVDVRDLASFMLDRIEAGDADVYGVVGPDRPITMLDVLDTARMASGADTELEWVPERFLVELGDERWEWLPMWHPDDRGAHTYDVSKAVGAGLRHRPFETTVRDLVAWDRERGLPGLKVGLAPEKEREILEAAA